MYVCVCVCVCVHACVCVHLLTCEPVHVLCVVNLFLLVENVPYAMLDFICERWWLKKTQLWWWYMHFCDSLLLLCKDLLQHCESARKILTDIYTQLLHIVCTVIHNLKNYWRLNLQHAKYVLNDECMFEKGVWLQCNAFLVLLEWRPSLVGNGQHGKNFALAW